MCLSCCFSSKGQDSLTFSKKYETDKNNIPLSIIRSTDCFFVLRYNKSVHDFTVEKRALSDGHLIHFTLLKLDDVCAHWFDYEKLDYLLIEKDDKLFFVFEKVLNDQKVIYQKTIDSTGHSGKFVTLCTLENDKKFQDIHFTFKTTGDSKLLVVGSQVYLNGVVSKSAALFDLLTDAPIWIKRLTNEDYSSASGAFETDANNDLWYLRKKHLAFKDSASNKSYLRDTLLLYHIPSAQKEAVAVALQNPKHLNFHDAIIMPYRSGILFFSSLYKGHNSTSSELSNGYFYSEYLTNDVPLYSTLEPYNEETKKKLTFYDGTDYNDPGYKHFVITDNFIDDGYLICVLERKDPNYYKDILAVKLDIRTGKILWQHVLPRKIFYFASRTLYKNLGCYSASYSRKTLNIFFLDHPKNVKRNLATTNYANSKGLLDPEGSAISKIKITDDAITKDLFYFNQDFSMLPLKNTPVKKNNRLVFYLCNGPWEKFGFE